MNDPADRLTWIMRNRGPRRRERAVGDVAAALIRRLQHTPAKAASRMALALGGIVDDEFRRYCRVVRFERGELVLAVSAMEMIFPLRRKWALELRTALPRVLSGRPPTRIVFEPGDDGCEIPAV